MCPLKINVYDVLDTAIFPRLASASAKCAVSDDCVDCSLICAVLLLKHLRETEREQYAQEHKTATEAHVGDKYPPCILSCMCPIPVIPKSAVGFVKIKDMRIRLPSKTPGLSLLKY